MTDPAIGDLILDGLILDGLILDGLAPEVQAAVAAGRAAAVVGLEELRSIELPLIDAVEPGHLTARLRSYGVE